MTAAPASAAPRPSPAAELAREFAASPVALASLVVLLGIVAAALFAPLLAPQDPYDLAALDLMDGRLPPGSVGASGIVFRLGSDSQGRDVLSAILYGLRTSLGVAAVSGLLSFTAGTAAGLAAAFAGGRVEAAIMRLVDLQLSFPTILLALILVAALGPGLPQVVLAIAAAQWAYFARTAFGAALRERRRDYVEAALGLALGRGRVLFRHILPNCLPPLIVVATVQIANSIALEATLSFLGLGLRITQPSLGLLIANGFQYMLSGRYWMSVFPGIALLITILAVNLVGDRLRDLLNPRLR